MFWHCAAQWPEYYGWLSPVHEQLSKSAYGDFCGIEQERIWSAY